MARLTCLKPRIQLAAAPKMAQPQAQERTRGTTWMNIRARILKRDCGLCQCQECKESGAIRLAHEVDHKVPLWEGGTDDDDNLQAINRDCHKRKSAAEAERRKL